MKGLESYLSKTAVWQECAESLSLVSNYKDLFFLAIILPIKPILYLFCKKKYIQVKRQS